jgi:mannose-6-phosphate isomerase-like protein (cupin superfamily)
MADHFYIDLELETKENQFYRRVIYTLPDFQLVLMSLKPGDEVPMETHPKLTQFIRVESGQGWAYIGQNQYKLYDGIAVVVPHNTKHRIVNDGDSDLKFYTIYSQPDHPDGLIED